jgi:hypothetical protein
MKLFLAIVLVFLSFSMFANPHADTIGMQINRTHKIIQTTIYVEKSIDTILSLDSLGTNKMTIITYDTLRVTDTTNVIDTSYFVALPLKFWRLESRNDAAITQINRWNWSEGGGNMFSILLANNSVANYARGFSIWRTELEWRYGGDKQSGADWFKTQDRFKVVSQYGFRASPTCYYRIFFDFNTQLSKGYADRTSNKNDYISRFLSPARFTFSLGMEYNNASNLTTPTEKMPNLITLLLSPITYNATYVMDTTLSTRFSIPAHEHWLSTLGPMVRLDSRHRLTKDVSLRNRLRLFANILEMHEPFVTVDWRVNFDIRLTRHFSLGIETWLIYDPTELFDKSETNPTKVRKTQFQQSLMLRFTHRFTN